jgi:hypothetical protein
MRLTLRDYVATVLVAAIGIPYVAFLMNNDVLFVKDERGMSAVGLILGAAAFLVLRSGNAHDRMGTVETGASIVSLALGIVALVFAEAGSAAVLLAVFMGSIAVVWLLELADHAGLVHVHAAPLTHG